MRCAFCEIKEIEERKITESNLAWAFPTNIPITVGHTLIIPKRCVAKFEDLTQAEVEAIFTLASEVKMSLIKTCGAQGFNVAYNENEIAGQSVPHFHLHIVPRKEGDCGIYKYEPREFIYRPGSREETPESELQVVAKEIQKNL
jgi:histidine triad (HIT) family protein